MTSGKPAGIIVSFALPLMLGNVFQQLYTVMDSVIVGRGVGVEALAALGTSDWLSFTAMGGISHQRYSRLDRKLSKLEHTVLHPRRHKIGRASCRERV